MTEPATWAIQKACDLLNAGSDDVEWRPTAHAHYPALRTFAAYIEAHEEPPVDPLAVALEDCMTDRGYIYPKRYALELAPATRASLTKQGWELRKIGEE